MIVIFNTQVPKKFSGMEKFFGILIFNNID